MRYHFIAIGGSAMHNLAIALHKKGHQITGSDDEIFEPSRSRLLKYGLLPAEEGWFPEKITNNLDAIVLGMHAKQDNPELAQAEKLGIKIYSYPEFLYQQTKNKTRIVVGGSHGKTSTTAMIMHVLKQQNIKFDYMVGAQIEGFDTMVDFSDDAKIAVFEGDEYLTSPLDLTPKFHHYYPDIAIVTGIAWDHINVFPTFEFYVEQFQIFANKIQKDGTLIWFEEDQHLKKIADHLNSSIQAKAYKTLPHSIENNVVKLKTSFGDIPIQIFGKHNLQNMAAAKEACLRIGVSEEDFFNSIKNFSGAAKRLEKLSNNNDISVFQDFAHSPSKLKATIKAVRENFSEKKLVAVMELHTFSSLNSKFLTEYKGSMTDADRSIVYFSKHALELKRLPLLDADTIKSGFDCSTLQVISERKKLEETILNEAKPGTVVLLMSSGNFDGIHLKEFADKLTQQN